MEGFEGQAFGCQVLVWGLGPAFWSQDSQSFMLIVLTMI